MPQLSYVVGVSELITDSLNTYSTFTVHDQTNYNYSGPSNSGKSLYIEFVNQRHYRAQQCFLSVRLVDNADSSVMLDKRYFITADNQLKIQTDFLSSLSAALKQPWPPQLAQRCAAAARQRAVAAAFLPGASVADPRRRRFVDPRQRPAERAD